MGKRSREFARVPVLCEGSRTDKRPPALAHMLLLTVVVALPPQKRRPVAPLDRAADARAAEAPPRCGSYAAALAHSRLERTPVLPASPSFPRFLVTPVCRTSQGVVVGAPPCSKMSILTSLCRTADAAVASPSPLGALFAACCARTSLGGHVCGGLRCFRAVVLAEGAGVPLASNSGPSK